MYPSDTWNNSHLMDPCYFTVRGKKEKVWMRDKRSLIFRFWGLLVGQDTPSVGLAPRPLYNVVVLEVLRLSKPLYTAAAHFQLIQPELTLSIIRSSPSLLRSVELWEGGSNYHTSSENFQLEWFALIVSFQKILKDHGKLERPTNFFRWEKLGVASRSLACQYLLSLWYRMPE